MLDQELEKLTRKVAVLTDMKFRRDEGIHPMFYAVTDKNKRIIFEPHKALSLPEEAFRIRSVKRAIVYMVEMLFAMKKVHRFVYVSEAWVLDSKWASEEDIEEAIRLGGPTHSPKRVEVVVYSAEDMEGNKIHGFQSVIRPSIGGGYLDDDLRLEDASEWETVGLFHDLLAFRKFHEARMKDEKNAKYLPSV